MDALIGKPGNESMSGGGSPHIQKYAPSQNVLRMRRILLCTDFSRSSQAALDVGVRISRQMHADVTVLHVREFGPMSATTDEGLDYVAKLYAERERQACEVVDRLKSAGVGADALVLDGDSATVILEQIRWLNADLVILGTRGETGLERMVFGSTAEAVLRKAPCPVLTVGGNCRFAKDEQQTSPVVLATEFQDEGTGSLDFAVALANTYEVSVHCVHVLPLKAKNAGSEILERVMAEGMKCLTRNGSACIVPPETRVVYGGDVSQAIVEYANETNAQAIVLGVRRKSWVAAHMPPQRTYRIILTAPCPVFTISGEHEGRIPVASA